MKKLMLLVLTFVFSQFMIFFWALTPLDTMAMAETSSSMEIIRSVLGYMSGYPAHFIAFFITTLLLSSILVYIKYKQPYLVSFLYSLFVSILIEVLQKYLTTYRYFDLVDVVFGAGGAGSLILIAKIMTRKKEIKNLT